MIHQFHQPPVGYSSIIKTQNKRFSSTSWKKHLNVKLLFSIENADCPKAGIK